MGAFWKCLLVLYSAAPAILAVKVTAPAHRADKRKSVSALQTKDGPPELAKATAAPLLLSLLKELKGEAEASMKYSATMSKWCSDTKKQKMSMVTVLKRKLDEAAIAVRQVDSEETRLAAEVRLANKTVGQKQKQLHDAAATASFAYAEFDSEQKQIEKTIDAAERTIRFIEMQQAQQAGDAPAPAQQAGSSDDLSVSLLQLSTDKMTEDERNLVGMFTNGDASAPITRADELLQMLTQLRTRLEQERNAELQEHNAMLRKLDGFTDHLNSSIIETQSQVAAIRMEAAQRKRAKAGWDGKITDLSTMLKAVQSSAKAVDNACRDDSKRRQELAVIIQNELTAATALLKKMPSSSSYLLFGNPDGEAAPADGDAAPSFVQVSAQVAAEESLQAMQAVKRAMEDLKGMAKRFPEESALYAEGARALTQSPTVDFHLPNGQVPTGGSTNKALDNIMQFVKDDSNKVAQKGEHKIRVSDEVKGLYNGILRGVKDKEHKVNQERGHCSSILRDADVDTASLERSMKRISAKLHIAQVAVSEHEESTSFQDNQRILIEKQLGELSKIAGETDRESTQFLEALRGHAEQLISLTTDLEPAEQEDTEHHIATTVRELAQKVEGHQQTLQQQQRRFSDEKKAVDNSEQVVLRLLSANALHNRRRLTTVKQELQLLTSLANAKADDLRLAQEYQLIASQLCSKDKVEKLGDKAKQLQSEITELNKAAAQAAQAAQAVASNSEANAVATSTQDA